MHRVHLATVLGLLLCAAGPAVAHCTITESTPLEFEGPYDASTDQPTDGRASLTFRCDRATSLTISLHASGRLGGTQGLRYDLFSDSARMRRWGDGPGGSPLTVNFGAGQPVTLRVYARIPPHQIVRAGAYTDLIAVASFP